MSRIRVRIWRDDKHKRVVPTADGPMEIERGETCVVITGRLSPKVLALIESLDEERTDDAG